MLKSLTTCVLLLALLVSSMSRFAVVMDYYANTEAFAANCENKALPQLHCNGKCQMMKKLKEQEKKESQSPERKIVSIELMTPLEEVPLTTSFSKITLNYFTFDSGTVRDIAEAFFHPPGIFA